MVERRVKMTEQAQPLPDALLAAVNEAMLREEATATVALAADPPQCGNCRFWRYEPGPANATYHLGRCRRWPPQMVSAAHGTQPTTASHDWCGDYQEAR